MKVLVGKNPAMKEALDALEQASIDPELLSAEEARRKALRDYNSNIEAARAKGIAEGEAKGRAEGIEKGIEKGRAEAIRMTALNLLKNGVSAAVIAKVTGLLEEEIEKIATEKRP